MVRGEQRERHKYGVQGSAIVHRTMYKVPCTRTMYKYIVRVELLCTRTMYYTYIVHVRGLHYKYYVPCTMYEVPLYIVRCTRYIVHRTCIRGSSTSLHSTRTMYDVPCTLYLVRGTMYLVPCTMYIVHRRATRASSNLYVHST